MWGTCIANGNMTDPIKNFLEKFEVALVEKSQRDEITWETYDTWEDNINMDFKKTGHMREMHSFSSG